MTLTLPNDLDKRVRFARNQPGNRETARRALDCLDLTALSGTETKADILELCDLAKHNYVAAVCVFPEHVATARSAIRKGDVAVATVINFPFGDKRTNADEKATPDTTRRDVLAAIAAGASQIDIVLPYEAFLRGEGNYTRSLLASCATACKSKEDVLMKVILESAVYEDAGTLRFACQTAMRHGAQCIKTSTGKHPAGGASLEAAAIMLDEIRKGHNTVGIKLSGGVKSNAECAQYMTLARAIMGWDVIQPRLFRIGSSSLLPHLLQELAPRSGAAPSMNY